VAAIDRLLDANAQYARAFQKGSLPRPPARKTAIVTCIDARIDPARAFGLEEGDAHVIRNAGGRMADALRSLFVSQTFLGTEEVMIVHHTDCGMLTLTGESLRATLAARGLTPDEMGFLPFRDVEDSVRADLAAYDQSPLVRHDIPVRGFVYDVETGRAREVSRTAHRRVAGG
jgi:carbonic anhydrase